MASTRSRSSPDAITINPNEVDTTWRLPRRDQEPLEFKIPILASAMDGVVDVQFRDRDEQARRARRAQSRRRADALQEPAGSSAKNRRCRQDSRSPASCKRFITEPVQEELIARARFGEMKDSGRDRRGQLDSAEGGALRRASRRKRARTFSSCKAPSRRCEHISTEYESLDLRNFCRRHAHPRHRREHRHVRSHARDHGMRARRGA